MDVSCIDESTTSSAAAAAASSPPKYPPDQSGGSAVTDAENGVEATSKKLPSSRFKGVVPQPNGRWGAQIYEKHQRVWLGTFNEEEQAARAYDTAVYRFRGRDGVANLKQESHIEKSSSDQIEYNFLNSRSKAEIVDMLRKHTYDDELEQYKRNQSINNNNNNNCFTTNNKFVVTDCRHVSSLEQLFEKTVTPSDVGKLNRLVIPKQHAEKHFPLNATTTTNNNNTNNATSSKGMLLNFDDVGSGKVWRFRYSYWNSSQSYVLTKGWSRFVKEKNLKAGDVVSFQRSSDNNNNNNQLYIDCKTRIVVAEPVVVRNVVRLFGVNICEAASRGGDAVVEGGGKRLMRELVGFSKKQRVMIDDAL